MMPSAGILRTAEILFTNIKEKIEAPRKKARLNIMRLRNSSKCSITDILLEYISFAIFYPFLHDGSPAPIISLQTIQYIIIYNLIFGKGGVYGSKKGWRKVQMQYMRK
jgi:hypothetical protein